MINSDKFTMIDENLIPTGEMKELKNSPLDFSKEFIVGSRINENYEQLLFTKGYDHNFIINQGKNSINFAAKLLEPNSGRTLEVFTTKPGLQFYSGNFLNNVKGKNNQIYDKHSGLCLETQFFPDSPNKPNFPTCVLKKDEEYKQRTIYKFKCF
jgi:aldose 1-epimerase